MSQLQSATALFPKPGSDLSTAGDNRLIADVDVTALADLIEAEQFSNGEIPWYRGEKTDPWDHVEAAIGLTSAGRWGAARRAFAWLQANQLPDGSWYAAYKDGEPLDLTRDANMTAYLAVGLFHHWLITGDNAYLTLMWPTLVRAMNFILSMQGPQGQIYWACDPQGEIEERALLTGSSSIYMSLKCALNVARQLQRPQPHWKLAAQRLRSAIRHHPDVFDATKARYSMDWFYPVLSGALMGDDARNRIQTHWSTFVVQGQGVRCVSDEPWVTIAETCELALALRAMGQTDLAATVFSWVSHKKYADGAYWCGHTFPEMQIWPEDKLTWTNAVAVMAADALNQTTPASVLFNHDAWDGLDFIGYP